MPPDLDQGGGCAMMIALALAVALDERGSVDQALDLWETRERPLIEHTQRWSPLHGRLVLCPDSMHSVLSNGSIFCKRATCRPHAIYRPAIFPPLLPKRIESKWFDRFSSTC